MFFIRMLTTFFERMNPASTYANPACMNSTSTAAISSQAVSIAVARSSSVAATLVGLLRGCQPCSEGQCDPCSHRRGNDGPIAHLHERAPLLRREAKCEPFHRSVTTMKSE